MMIPVRCFSCGKVVGGKFEEYKKRTEKGEQAGIVLDELGVERYCCRRMLMSHVDVIDELMKFSVK